MDPRTGKDGAPVTHGLLSGHHCHAKRGLRRCIRHRLHGSAWSRSRSGQQWSCDHVYVLTEQVFVNAGDTLTIDPGKMWRPCSSWTGASYDPGAGGRCAFLGDRFVALRTVGLDVNGMWGGVVLCGGAAINTLYLEGIDQPSQTSTTGQWSAAAASLVCFNTLCACHEWQRNGPVGVRTRHVGQQRECAQDMASAGVRIVQTRPWQAMHGDDFEDVHRTQQPDAVVPPSSLRNMGLLLAHVPTAF